MNIEKPRFVDIRDRIHPNSIALFSTTEAELASAYNTGHIERWPYSSLECFPIIGGAKNKTSLNHLKQVTRARNLANDLTSRIQFTDEIYRTFGLEVPQRESSNPIIALLVTPRGSNSQKVGTSMLSIRTPFSINRIVATFDPQLLTDEELLKQIGEHVEDNIGKIRKVIKDFSAPQSPQTAQA